MSFESENTPRQLKKIEYKLIFLIKETLNIYFYVYIFILILTAIGRIKKKEIMVLFTEAQYGLHKQIRNGIKDENFVVF